MLGRRTWFDAGSKGKVQCWIEGDGSILGNWMPKTNLAVKKKN
jgi:hypothetical protein